MAMTTDGLRDLLEGRKWETAQPIEVVIRSTRDPTYHRRLRVLSAWHSGGPLVLEALEDGGT